VPVLHVLRGLRHIQNGHHAVFSPDADGTSDRFGLSVNPAFSVVYKSAIRARVKYNFVPRSGSSSLAATFARFHSQPSSGSQERMVSADTAIPRRTCSSTANAAQLHRVRHQPNARGAVLSNAWTERLSDGFSSRSRHCFVACSVAPSKVSVPARYARTIRYTLEREQKRTEATSLGVRPAAHRSNRWRAKRYPYRARRNSARIRTCSSGGISTIVGLGTATPR
jgi:hypothetical protein